MAIQYKELDSSALQIDNTVTGFAAHAADNVIHVSILDRENWDGKQAALVVGTNLDSTPTNESTNPVTSGGVYSALTGKQDTLTIGVNMDSEPVRDSLNTVTSGGVFSAVGNTSFWRVGVEIPPYVPVVNEDITTGNATVRHPVEKKSVVLTLPDGVTQYTDADNNNGVLKDGNGNTVGSIDLTTGVLSCSAATAGSKITYNGANSMDEFIIPGVYYVGSGGNATVINNTPKNLAARVEIFPLWGSTRIMQRYFTYSSGEAKYYMRGYNPSLGTPWGSWYEYAGTIVT